MTDDGVRPGRLLELAVTDLALIDRLRLELADGLNVLTGETGAGKSLLIDALGLALGARADSSLVRHGAESARVEALFDRVPEPLIADPRGERRRTLDGPARRRVGDRRAAGPRDRARWSRSTASTTSSGCSTRTGSGTCSTRSAGTATRGRPSARPSTSGAPTGRSSRRSRSTPGSCCAARSCWSTRRPRSRRAPCDPARRRRSPAQLAAAQHAETIASGAVDVRDVLLGEGRGARERIAAAEAELRTIARLDGRWAGLADRLAGLEAEVEDVAAEVRVLAETVDHDPSTLQALEDRLGEIHRLLRRYGDDEATVIEHGERSAAEATRLRGLEDERARRAAEDGRLLLAVADAAASLSLLRAGTASELDGAVSSVLAELGFPADAFEVALGRRPAARDDPAVEVDGDAVTFDGSGIDTVVFQFRPNAGEPARPLARIASGGELSRVALAIKQVLAEVDATPTLVFDEIDTGIGGRSADPVGRSLWTLAREHQVLCVTHLPQIAAYADAHYRIAKREREGRTVTEIVRLDRAERERELAQMIGGPEGGDASLLSARELLDRAEAWRGGRLADALV